MRENYFCLKLILGEGQIIGSGNSSSHFHDRLGLPLSYKAISENELIDGFLFLIFSLSQSSPFRSDDGWIHWWRGDG